MARNAPTPEHVSSHALKFGCQEHGVRAGPNIWSPLPSWTTGTISVMGSHPAGPGPLLRGQTPAAEVVRSGGAGE
eukprot:3840411-Rhodomonas_salina.2